MTFAAARALELLGAGVADPGAEFRPGQQEAIRHVVQGDGRLLLVQKTGWGKSFVYFIAARRLREAGLGPALLVSPLLALMRNQIAAAERMGLCAQTINSDNAERWRAVEQEVRQLAGRTAPRPARQRRRLHPHRARRRAGRRLAARPRHGPRQARPGLRRPLPGAEELAITDYFIDSAFPTRDQVTDVLAALEAEPDGLSMRELEAEVNAGNGRIAKTIELLSLESPAPLARLDGRWRLTAAPLADAFWERTRRLTDLRLAEREQMQRYVRLTCGHMAFLIRALDGEPGDCRPPHLPALPAADPARVQEAIAFLRRSSLRLEPRKQWPAGRLIARTQRAQCKGLELPVTDSVPVTPTAPPYQRPLDARWRFAILVRHGRHS